MFVVVRGDKPFGFKTMTEAQRFVEEDCCIDPQETPEWVAHENYVSLYVRGRFAPVDRVWVL